MQHLSRINFGDLVGLNSMHVQNVCDSVTCVVTGLEMAWVQRPPEKVTNGEEFNVSYTVTATDSFYEYAVRNRIFQFR